MWSRRRFLETVSAVPLVGGFIGAGAAPAAAAAAKAARDYFRELGVRPFINAAGTYTAMTASLMPPEVMEAINYASKHYVMLDELHDRVGERIAKLVRADAAMVTSGAASALTLGTAAVLTGTDRQKIVDLPNLAGMKSEVIIQKAHRFGYDHAVRNCGVRLVEVETREDLERAVSDKTAMMLFYNNNNKEGRIQDEEFAQLGKKHGVPTLNDAAADVPPVENLWKYTGMGFDLVAFSGGKGHPRTAERRPAARPEGPHRGRPPERAAQRQHDRPRHEGEQGRDARHAGGARALPREGSRSGAARVRQARRDHPQQRRGRARRDRGGVRARGRQPRPARARLVGRGGHRADAAAAVVSALRDGEPSIGTRSEGRRPSSSASG